MKNLSVFTAFILATGIASSAGPTQIRIFPVHVDVVTAGNKTAPLVYISNESAHALTFEALPAGEVLAVFPPVATIKPGKRQAFRVSVPVVSPGEATKAGALKFVQISERDFQPEGRSGGARTELVVDVPVFANAPDAVEKLVRVGGKLRNIGTKQVLLTRIGDKNVHLRLLPGDEIEMLGSGDVFAGERKIEVEGDDEA